MSDVLVEQSSSRAHACLHAVVSNSASSVWCNSKLLVSGQMSQHARSCRQPLKNPTLQIWLPTKGHWVHWSQTFMHLAAVSSAFVYSVFSAALPSSRRMQRISVNKEPRRRQPVIFCLGGTRPNLIRFALHLVCACPLLFKWLKMGTEFLAH